MGRTRGRVTWRLTEWRTGKTYLDKNKEVFDAELYDIGEAFSMALKSGQTSQERASQDMITRWTKVYIWKD